MSRLRLVNRIITLAFLLALIALILVLASIPIACLWERLKKEGPRET